MTENPNNGTFGLPLEHQSSTGETSELSTNTSRVESSYDSRFPRVAGPRPVGDPDIPLYEEIERLQSENFAWRTKLGIRGYEIQITDLTQQLAAAIADAETNANETARVFELLAAERKARILAESDCAAAIMREESERKDAEQPDGCKSPRAAGPDTPRTDAVRISTVSYTNAGTDAIFVVPYSFCRQLERELAAERNGKMHLLDILELIRQDSSCSAYISTLCDEAIDAAMKEGK